MTIAMSALEPSAANSPANMVPSKIIKNVDNSTQAFAFISNDLSSAIYNLMLTQETHNLRTLRNN